MSIAAFALLLATGVQETPAEDLRYDNRGRPVVSVELNDKGPFDMVVDTGAQTSLLGASLADQFRLAPMRGGLQVNGATGSTAARIYPVDHLANKLFDARFVGMLEFPNPQTTSARGILGMEHFGGRKLLFDRVGHRLSVLPSGLAAPGFVAVAGTRRDDGLLEVPVTINGVRIAALIDTGAAVSLANAAVLKALGWAADDSRLQAAGEIRGATAGTSRVRRAVLDSFAIGPATMHRVPLYISDDADGDAVPTLILGSDLLNLFEAFALDFPRAELQIRLPGAAARR